MTIHQCPKCELRFTYKTELDDHCWHDHPEFHHEYPATAPPRPEEVHRAAPARVSARQRIGDNLVRWLAPKHPPEPRHPHDDAAHAHDGDRAGGPAR